MKGSRQLGADRPEKRLRWIQSSAAGMDWCLVPLVIELEIENTIASGAGRRAWNQVGGEWKMETVFNVSIT